MNRIKELRSARGITQEQLGGLLGVKKAAVCKYENEKVGIPYSVLEKLIDIFGVSADHILCKDDVTPLPKPMRERIGFKHAESDAVSVPLVGMVHAGEPMLAEENITEYIPVSAGEVYDGDYFFMEVVGDCMTGDHIAEGSIVLVRRGSDLRDGLIYVIRIEDEVLLRGVKRIKNSIALIPSNPAYDPMIVQGGDVEVIGRVVESRMRH
jgi:repressor LexA